MHFRITGPKCIFGVMAPKTNFWSNETKTSFWTDETKKTFIFKVMGLKMNFQSKDPKNCIFGVMGQRFQHN